MVSQMKTIASLDSELSIEERNLLSVAYKNVSITIQLIPSGLACQPGALSSDVWWLTGAPPPPAPRMSHLAWPVLR